MKAVAMRWQLC